MRRVLQLVPLIALALSLVPMVHGATVSGTVKGPDGKPFKGAFVEAQDTDTRIMTASGGQGPWSSIILSGVLRQ